MTDDQPSVEQTSTNTESSAPLSEAATLAALESASDKTARGKARMKEDDFPAAIELFSEALKLKTKVHGEMALECAPLYFDYGDALLSQLELSGDVFGEVVHEAEAEKEEGQEQTEEQKAPAVEVKKEDVGSDSEEEAEQDDPLKLAWENLDLARVIYEKNLPAYAKQLSDVLVRIGNLSAENDNMDQAIMDYQRSLELRRQLDPIDLRRIAESHQMLASAYAMKPDHDRCLASYREAIGALKQHVELIKSKTPVDEEEVKDVLSIIQLLDEKVEDMLIPDSVPADAQQMAKNFMQRMGDQVDPSMAGTIASVFAGFTSVLSAGQAAPNTLTPKPATAQTVNVLAPREKRKAEDTPALAVNTLQPRLAEKKPKTEDDAPSTS